jgi:hypothetical protein
MTDGSVSKTKIEKLKKEHGEVYTVSLLDGTSIYFKPLGRQPNSDIQAEVQRLSMENADDIVMNDRVEELVVERCVLEPSPEEFARLCEIKAGVRTSVVEQIYAVSGFAVLGTPQKL